MISAAALADPLPLAQSLLRCPSVTPTDGGAQIILGQALEALGFTVEHRVDGPVNNLIATIGTKGPHFGFAGHTDVVPPGSGWLTDPFGGAIVDNVLYGRGAVDMKGAIAAFVAAIAQRLNMRLPVGQMTLLITGDEEGAATDGTIRILEALASRNKVPDLCLVGEPTSGTRLGDVIKIGRRGSISAEITVRGVQGHVAYPTRADNPLHRLIPALEKLRAHHLDGGTEYFEPSSLQITSVDVGNPTGNIIPGVAHAALNIRFNDRHTGTELESWLRAEISRFAPDANISVAISGEPFRTEPGPLTNALEVAIEKLTGIKPRLDTGGGTSDARFIAKYCPVAEFGLVGALMHRTDEAVPVADLRLLARIYEALLSEIFKS